MQLFLPIVDVCSLMQTRFYVKCIKWIFCAILYAEILNNILSTLLLQSKLEQVQTRRKCIGHSICRRRRNKQTTRIKITGLSLRVIDGYIDCHVPLMVKLSVHSLELHQSFIDKYGAASLILIDVCRDCRNTLVGNPSWNLGVVLFSGDRIYSRTTFCLLS